MVHTHKIKTRLLVLQGCRGSLIIALRTQRQVDKASLVYRVSITQKNCVRKKEKKNLFRYLVASQIYMHLMA